MARRQLCALGFSRQAIEHRTRNGRLHRVRSGIYAIAPGPLTQQARWMAAVLSCGDGALLTHSSAAALWGFGEEWEEGIEVATRSSSPRSRPGVRVHRRPSLSPASVAERERIPVTTPVQTIVDLTTRHDRRALERMISDAGRLRLFTPPGLRAALANHAGEPGVALLRATLDRRTFRLTRSDLEQAFLPMAAEVGLPVPLTKTEQAQDRRRDQAHTAAGLVNLRFTDEQVRYEPAYVRRCLAETARCLGA